MLTTSSPSRPGARAKSIALLLVLVESILALTSTASPVYAASSIVQQTSTGSTNTTYTLTLTSVNSGDTLVVGVAERGASGPSSIGDSLSTALSQEVVESQGTGVPEQVASIYAGTLTSSGTDVVTVDFGSNVEGRIFAYEVSGVTTAGAATATGNGAVCSEPCTDSYSTSSTASFSAQAFVLGVVFDDAAGTFTAGTGFTASPIGPSFGYAEYATSGLSSPTDFPATASVVGLSSINWVEAGVALDPSPASVPEFPFQLALPVLFAAGVAIYLGIRRFFDPQIHPAGRARVGQSYGL